MPRARPRTTTPRALLAALACACVTLCACGTSGSNGAGSGGGGAAAGQSFAGAPLPPGASAPAFTLVDQDGRRVSLADYRGHVVVLAFVDSACAPACVLVAQQIRGALDDLAEPVPVLLVSVDPRADAPARVRAFLQAVSLAGRARYLAAPASALPAVWRAYRITTPSAGRAAFERGVSVLLVDPRGHERVVYQQEQLTPEALVHDIGKLRGG